MLRIAVGAGDHIQGGPDAVVTLVEYGDYECPFCARMHSIVKRLQKHFGGQLRFAFRHFPLTQIHPHARSAAEAAEFAAVHGRFWQMHDALFDNQDRLGPQLYFDLAAALRLPVEDLREALAKGVYGDKVRKDFMGGVRSGAKSTPSFFVNGERLEGPYGFYSLADAIDAALIRAHSPP